MLAQNIATQPRSTYDAHAVGSILSAVLWDTEVTQANLQTVFNPSVVAAMQAFGQALNTQKNQLTVPEALDAIASAISPMVQSQFCAVLEDRFHLQPTDVPHCPTDLTMLGATCAAP